jgi:hypothetical protein
MKINAEVVPMINWAPHQADKRRSDSTVPRKTQELTAGKLTSGEPFDSRLHGQYIRSGH